jgi:hypothetical protein
MLGLRVFIDWFEFSCFNQSGPDITEGSLTVLPRGVGIFEEGPGSAVFFNEWVSLTGFNFAGVVAGVATVLTASLVSFVGVEATSVRAGVAIEVVVECFGGDAWLAFGIARGGGTGGG